MKAALVNSVSRRRLASHPQPPIPADGCRWGGDSCLACRLPLCVYDLTREQRTRFFEITSTIVQKSPETIT
jgi:hypothetical protein